MNTKLGEHRKLWGEHEQPSCILATAGQEIGPGMQVITHMQIKGQVACEYCSWYGAPKAKKISE